MTAHSPPQRPRRQLVDTPPLDPRLYEPTAERPLRAKARVLANHIRIEPHHHAWGQLVFSVTGVTRVSAGLSTFIVPPSRAVWIPPRRVHSVTAVEQADLRTLYLHQAVVPDSAAWRECRVLEVSPLLRELVLQLATDPDNPPVGPADEQREHHLSALVLDELQRARPLRLGVDLPQDKRLLALCEAILDDPARHANLDGWAEETGASPRTIARLFRQELGTSFAQWRQQVLLARALSMAARKRPMSHIAAELGYASASAFTAMVTRAVGMPPSRFFAEA
nr:helix-turn-helix transcriptional regulator [uncultured Roseateles sp.]